MERRDGDYYAEGNIDPPKESLREKIEDEFLGGRGRDEGYGGHKETFGERIKQGAEIGGGAELLEAGVEKMIEDRRDGQKETFGGRIKEAAEIGGGAELLGAGVEKFFEK